MGGGHSALSPTFGLGNCHTFFVPCSLPLKIHDIIGILQVLIMFFNLLSSLPINLLLLPTLTNTQTCFGHYAVEVEVPTAS